MMGVAILSGEVMYDGDLLIGDIHIDFNSGRRGTRTPELIKRADLQSAAIAAMRSSQKVETHSVSTNC